MGIFSALFGGGSKEKRLSGLDLARVKPIDELSYSDRGLLVRYADLTKLYPFRTDDVGGPLDAGNNEGITLCKILQDGREYCVAINRDKHYKDIISVYGIILNSDRENDIAFKIMVSKNDNRIMEHEPHKHLLEPFATKEIVADFNKIKAALIEELRLYS